MTRRASSPIRARRAPQPVAVVTVEIDDGQPVDQDVVVGAWLDVLLSAMERRQAQATAGVGGDQDQAAATGG